MTLHEAKRLYDLNLEHLRKIWTPEQEAVGDALYAGRRLRTLGTHDREYDNNVTLLIASMEALKDSLPNKPSELAAHS